MSSSRFLSIPGGHNIRDLGGLPVDGPAVTRSGVLVRGEAPALLPAAGVDALVRHPVGTVIDLRGDTELDTEGLGALAYHIARGDVRYRRADMTVPMSALVHGDAVYDNLGRTYLACLNTGGAHLAATLADAIDHAQRTNTAVYVHCAVGKDRTGTVAALLLDALGASTDVIVEDYLLTGARFGPILNRLRTRPTYLPSLGGVSDAALTPTRTAITDFLTLLRDEHGGAAGWLADHGIGPDTVRSWRTALTTPAS